MSNISNSPCAVPFKYAGEHNDFFRDYLITKGFAKGNKKLIVNIPFKAGKTTMFLNKDALKLTK